MAVLMATASLASVARAADPACGDWPGYREFVAKFVPADGRVIDYSVPQQQTTSEGQSYAMFFALVANDRERFDKLLQWTRMNLSGGRFDAGRVTLPAWQWGRKPDGSYGVLDRNSAADADLWIAYDLFEAGRLWREPAYTKLGYALATQIAQQEVVDLNGLGPMLLPGKSGFQKGDATRVNPSYLPLPLLRALAQHMPSGPWTALAENAYTLVKTTSPRGFAPDWAAYQAGAAGEHAGGQFIVDPEKGDIGSYDAIRVYLWAGLAAPGDPLAKPWLATLAGMRERIAATGVPPERVATLTGTAQGEAPLGFWGALLPYFNALGDTRAAGLAQAHLAAFLSSPAADGQAPNAILSSSYYDQVLSLFGTGAAEGRYRFDEAGRLVPRWETTCQSATARAF
jgi:endoglucanase